MTGPLREVLQLTEHGAHWAADEQCRLLLGDVLYHRILTFLATTVPSRSKVHCLARLQAEFLGFCGYSRWTVNLRNVDG